MLITAYNPSTDDLEKTYLSQSYPSAITSIEVKNNSQIVNNNRLLIGDLGFAQSEIVTAGTPNSNATTQPVSATLFSHPANTAIYVLQFDQVKFYRSTTGQNGTYTLLQTVNIDVTNADLTTSYNDTTAASGYYYKISVYNSVTGIESAQSDPIPAVTGWATNQVGYVVNLVLKELNDPNEENVSRDEIIGWMQDVNDDLKTQVVRPYNFLYTRTVFGRTAGATSLAWPTDSNGNQTMWKFDRMDYNFVDSTTTPVTNDTYTVEVVSLAYFRNRHISNTNDSTTQDDQVQEMALNEATKAFDYFPGSKTSSNAVWYLYYWTALTDITTEGQTLQTPTSRIYKLYILYRYYLKRAVTEPTYLQMSDRYKNDYLLEKAKYKSQDRRDVGTPRRFESEGWVRKSFRR